MSSLRCGVLGYGLIGRVHYAAYETIARDGIDCTVRVAENAAAVTQDNFDVVSICTPTDTHVNLALRAMNNGVHVLLEKPVALRADAIAPIIDAARTNNVHCMPAHCMRFWPGWPYARNIVQAGVYGVVKSATFRRIASMPNWNDEFYHDVAKSGGALFDLHIHDADFILWCFGQPRSIAAAGSIFNVETRYDFGGFEIEAQGAWLPEEVPFQMQYRIELEDATLDFSFDRVPALTITRAGTTTPVELPAGTAYEAQARHFLDVVSGTAEPVVRLDDAVAVTTLLARELATCTKTRYAAGG